MQFIVRGTQPPRLQSVRPASSIAAHTSTKRSFIPRLTISREGAADCARGGRAPHFICMDSTQIPFAPRLLRVFALNFYSAVSTAQIGVAKFF
jgi:hypothetical protein